MRRVLGAQIVAIVSGVLAQVVRKIMAAVVTGATAYVGSDHHTVAHFQGNAFEVGVRSRATDRGDGAYVLVTLNNGERNLLGLSGGRVLPRSR